MKRELVFIDFIKCITLIYLTFIQSNCLYSQVSLKEINGNWKVKNVVFLFTSDYKEKEQIRKKCLKRSFLINDSLFQIQGLNKCEILTNKKGFKVEKPQSLSIQEARNKYNEKVIYYIFDKERMKVVEIYRTNYKVDSFSEENMEVIKVNKNSLILLFDYSLIFVDRIR